MTEPKYIHFEQTGISPTGKTKIWAVLTSDGEDTLLGHIKYYGAWHQYSFYTDSPFTDLVFEKQCLRDIANFCEEQSKLQRSNSLSESRKGENK